MSLIVRLARLSANSVCPEEFHPPLSGGSLRARTTKFVEKSIALRMTLKPIDSSRWPVTNYQQHSRRGLRGFS